MTDTSQPRVNRRDPSRGERLEVLQMLESGAITADEADTLLDALDRAERSTGAEPSRPGATRSRQVRIRVSDTDGRAKVNLALPLGLVDAGLGIARRFAPDRVGDAETIRDAISNGFQGSLLDVHDGGERVEIIVE